MTTWVYRLSYTVWHNGTETRIKNDIVQFTEPQSLNDIITGLWQRYVMLRDENVSVGDCDIQLLSS
jgi:hypothetical protein